MLVTVGRIGRAHGVRGDVSVEVRTDSPEVRFTAGAALATDPAAAGPLTVAHARWHSGRLLVRFEGVHDRTAAERLRGVRLFADVAADERPEDPEEYYDHQLTGLAVRLDDGAVVGEVSGVVHVPGQDLLAVHRPGGAELLVPFVAEIVPTVDLAAGEIVVAPPPGLIEAAEPDGAAP